MSNLSREEAFDFFQLGVLRPNRKNDIIFTLWALWEFRTACPSPRQSRTWRWDTERSKASCTTKQRKTK